MSDIELSDCEHDDYEAVGSFPKNMFIDGECMANKIKCLECGKIGKELYQFVERDWEAEI